MNKRYIKWGVIFFCLSFVLTHVFMRPDLKALFSRDFWENLSRYSRVMRLIESEYVYADDVSYEQLTNTALKQLASSLDPYSKYMTEEDYDHFNMASNREYVGVGIELSEFAGRVRITQVFAGGSAAESGVEAGDWVIGVDGEDVRNEVISDVSERIRGESGSLVALELERFGATAPLVYELERGAITLESVVDVEMRAESIGYMRLTQFTERAGEDLKAALAGLQGQGLRALILDLRNNPGGRLDTAAEIAELFLEGKQRIVTVESRRGVVEAIDAESDGVMFTGPMVVLINGNSASASEILAGAFRDHRRAVLVGAQTFGKGSVQSIYGFNDGHGLKLTSARYLLPDGEAIHGVGVAPDVEIIPKVETRILRVLQEHHLSDLEDAAFEARFGFAPIEDEALLAAEEILAGLLAAQQFAVK